MCIAELLYWHYLVHERRFSLLTLVPGTWHDEPVSRVACDHRYVMRAALHLDEIAFLSVF